MKNEDTPGRKYYIANRENFNAFLTSLNQESKPTLAAVRAEIEGTYGTEIPDDGLVVFEIATEVVKKAPRVVRPNGFEFQSQRKLGPRKAKAEGGEATEAPATDTESKPHRRARKSE